MGIFKRLTDIISANLNDLIEDAEDPVPMLKQAVREMEAAIGSAKRDVARAMANEKMVAKELAANQKQALLWTQRAEVAVEQGNDQLARQALGRKREHDKVAAALEDQHQAAEDAANSMRRQLEAMQAKLADAQRRLGTLAARQKAAEIRSQLAQSNLDPEVGDDAFAKFERLRMKVDMAEAEAEAFAELSGSDYQVTRAIDDAVAESSDLDVEAELMMLKQRLGHQG